MIVELSEVEIKEMLYELDKAQIGDTYLKRKLRKVLNPNPRRASWLTSRGQAAWMTSAGIIRNPQVVKANVMQRRSRQCPNGFEICRVSAEIIDFDPHQIGPKYCGGDSGYEDQGFHNDWRWEDADCKPILLSGPAGTQPATGCLPGAYEPT